jgi:Mg-chelatase subunit ChlI
LPRIPLGDDVLFAIASACTTLKVDGQRPDIVIAKTARAVAALDGREQISQDDVLLAAHATLGHRTRDGGLLEAPAADEIAGAFRSQLSRARKDAASPKRAPAASGTTLPPGPSPAPQPIASEGSAPAPEATPKKG